MGISDDMKIKQFEHTVQAFLTQEQGYILSVSTDGIFTSVLRQTLIKQLALDADCLSVLSDGDLIIKTINQIKIRHKKIVLFIERVLHDREMSFIIKQVKTAYPEVRIIVLTGEADRQELVLLHEIGADNFITKPVSMNTLIEKMAFTIKPQGKIGAVIEDGKALVVRGDFANALKVARKVLEIKPGSAAGYLIVGDSYKGMGKLDKAEEAYLEASKSAHLYMEPLKRLAALYREMGETEQALGYLEKLDGMSPLNVERKVDMGTIHLELGNSERADNLFTAAVEQATKAANTYIGEVSSRIAEVYSDKDPSKAEVYYRKALNAKGGKLDKSDVRTFTYLGISLRRQGRWEDALEEYNRALEVDPDNENIFYNMAMACAEGKDFKTAAKHAESVLRLNPDFHKQSAVVAYNVGYFLARGGKGGKARLFFEQALEMNPDMEAARKALANL